MNRIGLGIAGLAVLLSSAAFAAPKYVFLFIGDGMSTPQRMIAEEFSRLTQGGELAMNRLPYQANTRTRSANRIITDSAAAATAIACGVKTENGKLGVLPYGKGRVESVAEVAKRTGKKVGIATTVTIVHATPAGFYAHRENRGQYYRIGLDLIASGFDFFTAGGVYDRYDDKNDPEYRGELRALAQEAGYKVLRNDFDSWCALKPGDGKTWSIFGDYGMQFAIDADGSQPTPAEIVAKGIELLDGPDGFFFMFEGGKVDYSGHANDAATNIRDILALDEAVKVALKFQDAHPDETLVVTTGDHETGGMSMGFMGCGGRFQVELLAHQKISVEKFSNDIKQLIADRKGELTFDEVQPLLTEKFGLDFSPAVKGGKDSPLRVTKTELKQLREAFAQDVENVRKKLRDTTAHDVRRLYVFAQAVKNVVNAHAGIGWSSGAHTALPTFTTAKGPGADILVGVVENADLGQRLKGLLAK